MEAFGVIFDTTFDIFSIEFTLFGYTMTMMQVFIWSVIAFVVLYVIFYIKG